MTRHLQVVQVLERETARSLARVVDVEIGLFTAALGDPEPGLFLRVAGVAGSPIDEARASYLELARPRLRSAKPGWSDGPGLVLESATVDEELLRVELVQVKQALLVLGDARIARSYLEIAATPMSASATPTTMDRAEVETTPRVVET